MGTALPSDQLARKLSVAEAVQELHVKERTKLRIVFKQGRDLNIFGVVNTNLDGSWWRFTDDQGRLYIVNPDNVNYQEQKTL